MVECKISYRGIHVMVDRIKDLTLEESREVGQYVRCMTKGGRKIVYTCCGFGDINRHVCDQCVFTKGDRVMKFVQELYSELNDIECRVNYLRTKWPIESSPQAWETFGKTLKGIAEIIQHDGRRAREKLEALDELLRQGDEVEEASRQEDTT